MRTVRPGSRAGFSLVEVALALGVAAFCLIPLFGLLPIGVNTDRASVEQTGAVNAALAVISDLRATALLTPPANPTTSTVYGITIPDPPPAPPINCTQPTMPPGSTTLFVRQDGSLSGKVGQNADPTQVPRYRISLYFSSAAPASATTPSPTPIPVNATVVRVLVTWPALADASASATPSRYSGSFATLAALVRN